MMKKSILIAALGLLSFNVSAQDTPKTEEGFIFTTVKENPITSVKKPKPLEHLLELLSTWFPRKRTAAHGQGRV